MGCASSAPNESGPDAASDSKDWITVAMNTETGDVVNQNGAGETLAKCTLERMPDASKDKPVHFVKQKIGGEWQEKKLGFGAVKYTCLDPAALQELTKDSAAPWQSEGSTASVNSLTGFSKANDATVVAGLAEWKGSKYVVSGVINETINVVDLATGEVVLTLWQATCGVVMKFYNKAVAKKRFRASVTEEEVAELEKSFVGMRLPDVGAEKKEVQLFLKPEVLDKVPMAFFAIVVLYSNHGLNGMDSV